MSTDNPNGTWITKDSGKREEFDTGARRDTQDDKDRYDLIPIGPLKRLADLYARGAKKYGEHNYQKGIPFRRVYSSLLRHLYQWAEGDRSEDHLAAVAWNAFALMFYEIAIQAGKLPKTLNDINDDDISQEIAKQVFENSLARQTVRHDDQK